MNSVGKHIRAALRSWPARVLYPNLFREPDPILIRAMRSSKDIQEILKKGALSMVQFEIVFFSLARVGISLNRYLVAVAKEAREADRRFQAMEGFGKIPRGACRYCMTGELHYLGGR